MKIITPNKLNRKAGKTYVFTNGCFDILHAGHIRLLKKAKSFGDFLIVGLNSDRSVKQIKGLKRPIVPQDQRVEVLSAIESVDYIIMYDKPTPLELILRVKPDVLVKGEDWKDKVVIGSKEMEMWGGRVELVDFTVLVSTSRIIETITRRNK